MDAKIDQLLHEVERLLMHIEHHVPAEVVVTENVRRLVNDIRAERKNERKD
jgi:hypothetical protein